MNLAYFLPLFKRKVIVKDARLTKKTSVAKMRDKKARKLEPDASATDLLFIDKQTFVFIFLEKAFRVAYDYNCSQHEVKEINLIINVFGSIALQVSLQM